jgi:hypothetical protein
MKHRSQHGRSVNRAAIDRVLVEVARLLTETKQRPNKILMNLQCLNNIK